MPKNKNNFFTQEKSTSKNQEKKKKLEKKRSEEKKQGSIKYENKGTLRIPSRLERLFEEYIEYKTNKPIQTPNILNRIKQSIQVQKKGYWKDSPDVTYEKGYDVFAYLAYQAPGYLIQFRHLLKQLDTKGILPETITLLDLGSGPGIVPLATLWYYKERKKGKLVIHAIEKSDEFLEAFRYLVPEFMKGSSNVTIGKIQLCDIVRQECDIPDNITLLTCQNVLAELSFLSIEEKSSLLMRYCSKLSEDGIIIIVEPAELRHSIELRKLQKNLEGKGLYLYSPCPHYRIRECNYNTCWSFEELPQMIPTSLMNILAGEKEGFRYINTDIKFSYSIFTKKEMKRQLPEKNLKKYVPLHELEYNLGEWIDVSGAKMSPDLGNRQFSVFLICDGTGYEKTYLVIPKSLHHDEIKYAYKASYGEILKIQNVRVRYNEKKNAFNLISGTRTHVSAMNI